MKIFILFVMLLSLNISTGFAYTCDEANVNASKASRAAYQAHSSAIQYKYTAETNTEACEQSMEKINLWNRALEISKDSHFLWSAIDQNCPRNRALASWSAGQQKDLQANISENLSKAKIFNEKTCAAAREFASSQDR